MQWESVRIGVCTILLVCGVAWSGIAWRGVVDGRADSAAVGAVLSTRVRLGST